jgi:2-dehydropantoate 2-reductase
MISAVCGPDTTLFSVMNGIDSEERLAAAIGDPVDGGRVLLCMVAGMDAVRDANAVEYTRLGTVFIGERRNVPTAPAPRVEALQHHLQAAGFPGRPRGYGARNLEQVHAQCGINQWSAVLGARYGVFHRQGAARDLMRDTMAEVLAVARSRGVALSADDLEGGLPLSAPLG